MRTNPSYDPKVEAKRKLTRTDRKARSRIDSHEVEVVFVRLIQLGDLFQKRDDECLRPLGLTSAQYNVLRILEGAEKPLAQKDIAKRLLVSRANITGLIDKLETAGFVERCTTEDRRVNLIHLTDLGLEFLQQSYEAVLANCEAHLAPLSPAERDDLMRLTSKLLLEEKR